MVTTRRQTRVTAKEPAILPPAEAKPQPTRKPRKRKEKVEDSESEAPVEPKAKRQRTSATSNTKTTKMKDAAAGKRRKREYLLTDMPLDVLFEMLTYMAPLDLANLSYTNKLFWETLTGPAAASMWKVARRPYKAPDPPKDFSEPRWAILLFGTLCQTCGGNCQRAIDWHLRKRYCLACEKLNLVSDVRFKSSFRGRDIEILDYLPFTRHGPSTKGWRQYSDDLKIEYFWKEDVEVSLQQWEKLTARKSAKGKEELEAWIKRREEQVAWIFKMAPTWSKWDFQLHALEEEEKEYNKRRRMEGAKARLLEMGYEQVDIDRGITLKTISPGVPNVTNAVWAKIRKNVENLVIDAKRKRLSGEDKGACVARMATLKTRYHQFLARLPVSESYCCPPVDFLIGTVPALRKPIEAKSNVSVTAQDFDSVFQEMPDHIAEYHKRRKEAAADTILPGTSSENLDLARFVFRCDGDHRGAKARSRVLQGWPMIASHCCAGNTKVWLGNGVVLNTPRSVVVDWDLSAIASILLELVGLSPQTTAISEMDEKDARFVCIPCYSESNYQVLLTWRGVIYHVACGGHQSTDLTPPFRLASSEDTTAARQVTITRQERAKAWSCNHCLKFVEADNAETIAVVLQHLKEKHGISEPKLLDDYFVNERCRVELEWPSRAGEHSTSSTLLGSNHLDPRQRVAKWIQSLE